MITGDFVTIEDGTGIVHIAPTFGADDDRVAKQHGISPLVVKDTDGKMQALVDRKGRFYPTIDLDPEFVEKYVNTESYHEFAGRPVKNEYDDKLEEDASTVDVDIAVMLKQENKAFKVEKHVHSYPHCWRTDKPVLYYPLDSWFIKSTAVKDKMVELNKTINWKPRFNRYRPFWKLARKPGRLEPQPFTFLGNSAADLAYRRCFRRNLYRFGRRVDERNSEVGGSRFHDRKSV